MDLINLGAVADDRTGDPARLAFEKVNRGLLEALAIGRGVVRSRAALSPPGGAVPGEAWLVPAGATGAWEGRAGQVAVAMPVSPAWPSGWTYVAPSEGAVIVVADEDVAITWTGGAIRRDARAARLPTIAVAATLALGADHLGAAINATAGAGGITLTLPAVAPVGALIRIRKADAAAGRVTVQAGVEQVAWLSAEADSVTARATATGWEVVDHLIAPLVRIITASGSQTRPPLAVRAMVTGAGATGGSGGGARAAAGIAVSGGAGAGSGGIYDTVVPAAAVAPTYDVTIAAGGAAGLAAAADSTAGGDGGAGGVSVWAGLLTFLGGAGGQGGRLGAISSGGAAVAGGVAGGDSSHTASASGAASPGGAAGAGISAANAALTPGVANVGQTGAALGLAKLAAAAAGESGARAESAWTRPAGLLAARLDARCSGGGGAGLTGPAGHGGAGAPGMAPSGGGSARNGFAAGNGGVGGDAVIREVWHF